MAYFPLAQRFECSEKTLKRITLKSFLSFM